jgi:general secretion pathway protein B
MSYILDALNKADARRQTAVPNLHTHVNLPETLARSRAGGSRAMQWWALAVVLAAACIAALWFMLSSLKTAAPAATKPAPSPAIAVPAQAPPAPVAAPVTAPTVSTPASTVAVTAPKPAVAPNVAPAVATAAASALGAAPKTQATPPAKPAPTTRAAAIPPAPKPAAPAPPLPSYAKLSDAQRSGMPALSVGGSVFSPEPAARILMLNGQVLKQGDQVVDGLTVESIGAKASTLNWRGTRFQLPH